MRRLTPSELVAELDRRQPFSPEIRAAAEAIVDDVRRRGDEALLEYTRRWDAPHLTRDELALPPEAPAQALAALPASLREALETAAARIAAYHRRFVPESTAWTDAAGNRLGRLVQPLDRVGIYVPGGRAAYPSTVLMTAIPARLAGVGEIVLATPPRPDGSIPPVVLAAAALAGVHRVIRAGGAQAVAALAYGTATVPAVDKIVGPGNAYVTAAKAAVAHRVGIDSLAGPSEIVVVADDSAHPAWVAADLLAQAEHDPLAVVGCLSPVPELLDAVAAELDRRLEAAPRAAIAAAALERGFLVATASLAEAIDLASRLAPEHLSLQVRDPEAWLRRVRAAGAVFLGPFAPVAAGDYAAGTNHVLPTGGAARFQGALSPEAFVRCIPFFAGSREGVAAWAPAARVLAEAEGLPAHAASIRLREGDEPGAREAPAGTASRPQGAPGPAAVRLPEPQDAAVAPPAEPGTPKGARAGGAAIRPQEGAAPAGAPGYTVADSPAPVKLDANEAEPWPAELREALVAEMGRILAGDGPAPHRYPARALRQAVTAQLAAYARVPEEAVVLGNGSDELVQAVLGTLGRHCTAAVAPSPTFGYYATAAAAAGVPYRPVPVPPERAVTLDDLVPVLDGLPGEKLVFLCRPNNPTGLSCDADVVWGLLQRGDTWLVVDEAYAEFAGESVLDAWTVAPGPDGPATAGSAPRSCRDDGGQARGHGVHGDSSHGEPRLERLVILRTLSKAFALAGARVGYAVAAPAVASRLRRWLQPYNVNTFSLVAARVALEHREVFRRRAEATRRRRDRLFAALGRVPGITPLPSRGNFLLFRVEPAGAARRLQQELAQRGIAVRAFPWEPSLDGYLRVTVGTEEENQAFLTALAELQGGGQGTPAPRAAQPGGTGAGARDAGPGREPVPGAAVDHPGPAGPGPAPAGSPGQLRGRDGA
ncbi:histidinol dehydrogenase [Thermaerobacter marianensis DSM 12885]|uniref:Histidinol dehydrogenase n=1 Tax=Thermaerobacter marianensis (strain ATCC 700841 / DSM 12885 / JCM 10246 / 7p75a) TaxID=644966 RepID=E6SHF2_THEM7|nr:histidinol dehydrogenase [Thermaerobacter marianensis]ADU50716.1 histidinol dehydrogenase [Thermaerobacter marianensis DSM 12885]